MYGFENRVFIYLCETSTKVNIITLVLMGT